MTARAIAVVLASSAGCHLLVGLHPRELDDSAANGSAASGAGGGSGGGFGAVVVDAVALGQDHSCALAHDGRVFCWGDNSFGQLGQGGATKATVSTTPLMVKHGDGTPLLAVAIAAGQQHTCALGRAKPDVWCWGLNAFQQLGALGADTCTPPAVPCAKTPLGVALGAAPVTALAAGSGHSCAVDVDHAVSCWGLNASHQTGTDKPGNQPPHKLDTPVPIPPAEIVLGGRHGCARMTSGGVACWGENGSGQLGVDVGTFPKSAAPAVVPSIDPMKSIGLGANHTCGVTTTGTVWCWGDNTGHQLGDGKGLATSGPTAVQAAGLTGIERVVGGAGHTCALEKSGRVDCWGVNDHGQAGTDSGGADVTAPTIVKGVSPVGAVSIAAGAGHTCAVLKGGVLVCWGDNSFGKLGAGTGPDASNPVEVHF